MATETERTAADKTAVGLEHQYYFFLWKLLSLRAGETVGLEVKDDVHTSLNSTKQILYQLKHTLTKKNDGTATNLTSLDSDLWKTLSNWSKVICDACDGRAQTDAQLEFIEKTWFVLCSNKSYSNSNVALNEIHDLRTGTTALSDLRAKFTDLTNRTKDETIESYISDVLSLEDSVLLSFCQHVSFELNVDDLISKCKDAIKSTMIPEKHIDRVFSDIDSAIRRDNYLGIKDGVKNEISFDSYYRKYRRYYDLARNDSLRISPFSGELPEQLEDQVFIKQLLELGDVRHSELDVIAEYTEFLLKLSNNIETWLAEGDITFEEVEEFKKEAKRHWTLYFRRELQYPGESMDETELNESGLRVLHNVREQKLMIAGQDLAMDLSNGEFYRLSNVPEIGWRQDWEKYQG